MPVSVPSPSPSASSRTNATCCTTTTSLRIRAVGAVLSPATVSLLSVSNARCGIVWQVREVASFELCVCVVSWGVAVAPGGGCVRRLFL